MLGLSYLQGIGVPQDTAEAMKWLRQAAEQEMEGAITVLQAIEDAESERAE